MMKVVEFIEYSVPYIKYWKGKHKSGSIVNFSQAVLYWKHKVLA